MPPADAPEALFHPSLWSPVVAAVGGSLARRVLFLRRISNLAVIGVIPVFAACSNGDRKGGARDENSCREAEKEEICFYRNEPSDVAGNIAHGRFQAPPFVPLLPPESATFAARFTPVLPPTNPAGVTGISATPAPA